MGYGRVSTRGQNLDRQIRALTKCGCAKIFTDKLSGKNTDRPELIECLKYLREGDTLVVPSLDRLARSLQDLITITVDLRKRGIGFKSLHENLDTTTSGGRLVFHVFAALAEFIRELIIENTREGVAAAKARGQRLGRPKAMTEEQVSHAVALLSQPKASAKAIAELLGVSRSTLYAYVPELAAIRAAAAKQTAAEVPAQRPALTREPEAWWQLAEFTLNHSATYGWQLTHQLYPANPGHPIPVENYPAGNSRLRRNIVAAQAAAAAAIEDLTGHRVQDWEEEEDAAGEPYWEAFLDGPLHELARRGGH
ncbi:MAG: recombinase family protein [Catenulispora sp.]|nr:recombinase family protein [Catenulispora sp.]NUT40021.1 recombinase family protein [Thermoactinospora sp.]